MTLLLLKSIQVSLRQVGLVSFAMVAGLVVLPKQSSLAQTESDIIIRGPVILPYPTYPQRRQRVRVRFIAEGDAWGSVYLDRRLLFSPRNFNRNEEFWLDRRAYHLEIRGATRFDVWDSGYLDVGRGDSGALIVIFSEEAGVRVIGDPYAWLPDGSESRR